MSYVFVGGFGTSRVISTQGPQSQKVHTEKNPHVWCLSGQYGMRYSKQKSAKKIYQSYLQTDATTPNNVGSCCVRFHAAQRLTSFKLCATTPNNMQQGVQTDATCNIQQCRVRLHGALEIYRRPDNVSGNLYISY